MSRAEIDKPPRAVVPRVQRWAFVPAVLLAAGAVLVALAVFAGGAGFAIVVIVPVLYGRSLEFAGGVPLLIAGIFSLPLAFAAEISVATEETREAAPSATASGGGVVLIGPVPLFFGSWRGVSARIRWLVAIVGAAVLVAAIALVLLRG